MRERQTRWYSWWREHQRKVAEVSDWPLEDRLNSWAHLEREYTKLRQGGHTPWPAGSEIGLSQSDLDSTRFTKEIETFQALNVEKLALNDRLKLERNSNIQSWHEGWNRQREENLSMGQPGRRQEFMQELREFRNSQREIMRESQERLQNQMGAAQTTLAGSGLEAERTRLEAELTQVEADASRELLQLLQVGHDLRQA